MAKEKDKKNDTKEPDYNEVRPPIDTKGKSFDELLKGIAGVDPCKNTPSKNSPQNDC